MKKEALSISMSKLVIVVSLIVGIGSVCGVMGYYLTKKLKKTEVFENKIAWDIYDSSDSSLFDWEKYNIRYHSDWHYTEKRVSSSRKLGALKTIFTDNDRRSSKLLITVGGDKLDNLLTKNIKKNIFLNNTFYKYDNDHIKTGQVYYIYKTGTDEEISLGTEVEIIFEFNNVSKDTIKEILESFNLQPSKKLIDWKTYQNKEYQFGFKYPKELSFLALGPNEVQKKIENNDGKLMSGTSKPSFNTIVFSDEGGRDIFEVSIFYPKKEVLSKENYIEKYFYLYGFCNASAGFEPVEINIFNTDETDIMRVSGTNYESSVFRGCYYFKNNNNNLIVFSSYGFKGEKEFKKIDLMMKDILTNTMTAMSIERSETRVYFPSAGDVLEKGKSYKILWKVRNENNHIDMRLYNNDASDNATRLC
ncbi:MAG: hypothetical protein U9P70_02185 [Patescibacteria group bacterium]|nr:hypothetical protein [Patescibacteria group bacterium]